MQATASWPGDIEMISAHSGMIRKIHWTDGLYYLESKWCHPLETVNVKYEGDFRLDVD
jgi:hypothetical protein